MMYFAAHVGIGPPTFYSVNLTALVSFNLHAYIINLDTAVERWAFVSRNFESTGIPFTRVSGVLGREVKLPHPRYSSLGFTLRHGHKTNFGHIGCYFSHLKCLELFLQSSHSHAIIAEDDASPTPQLRQIIEGAIEYQPTWDVLRLCGFHNPHAHPFVTVFGEYQLAVCMTRLCGTACYVVTRHAAEVLLQGLDPMALPIDHAIDREWAHGLCAAAVVPLPVSQRDHGFITQCAEKPDHKHPWYLRYWSVFPYRGWTETNRFIQRRLQLRRAKQYVMQKSTG